MKTFRWAVPGVGLLLSMAAVSHPPTMDREAFFEAFGWDPQQAEITVETLAEGRHVLFGLGGNILASIGEQGTLLVDNQIPEIRSQIDAALAELGSARVDFTINTHWHFDHADGNLSYGPDGTWLIAHEESRRMLTGDRIINMVGMAYEQAAYPTEALPVITFDDRMQLHFNGERIDLIHAGPAHTTGDTAVIFRGHGIVHMGDVFVKGMWPFIDFDSGGDLDGMIRFVRAVLEEIDDDAIVVPGHGPVADRAAMVAYVQRLETVRGRIAELVDAGADLDAVMAAEPTAGIEGMEGDPTLFVNRAYHSLRRSAE
ncbi:MAG: MBL fold metallo-hydrolase [Gammaproteobacteria bacterium]|nr:MBL fold metallo-hydrolase [Gammaproteobacteria bacterium]